MFVFADLRHAKRHTVLETPVRKQTAKSASRLPQQDKHRRCHTASTVTVIQESPDKKAAEGKLCRLLF